MPLQLHAHGSRGVGTKPIPTGWFQREQKRGRCMFEPGRWVETKVRTVSFCVESRVC